MAELEETRLERTCVEFSIGEIDTSVEWKYGIVLQGPYVKGNTDKVIEIFLQRNPAAIVVVATYLLADGSSPDSLFPVTVDHTGRLVFVFVRKPSKTEEPDFWKTNYWNQNLHRLTSFVGLRFVNQLEIPYAMKMRSDSFLGMPNVCEYLVENFIDKYPVLHRADVQVDQEKLGARIAIGEYSKRMIENPRLPHLCEHDICDFWFFGRTTDVLNYFSIREDSCWNRGSGITLKRFPETNLSEVWMRDVGIPLSMEVGEVIGRYLAVPSSVEVEFNWMGRWHRDHRAYLVNGKRYLRERFTQESRAWRLVTYEKWLTLNKDND